MRVRITSARPASSPRLAVLGCAALMVLLALAVSACTGTPPSTAPSIPGSSGSSSESSSSSSTATSSASADASASTTHPATPSSHATTPTSTATTVSPSPVPTTTYVYPTGAPQTGGGGTAGLQDGLVFVLGGAAIAAGLGSLAYRRKFTRRR
jgi:hypothetical protein